VREIDGAFRIKNSSVFDLLKALADKASGQVAEAKDAYQAALSPGLPATMKPGAIASIKAAEPERLREGLFSRREDRGSA